MTERDSEHERSSNAEKDPFATFATCALRWVGARIYYLHFRRRTAELVAAGKADRELAILCDLLLRFPERIVVSRGRPRVARARLGTSSSPGHFLTRLVLAAARHDLPGVDLRAILSTRPALQALRNAVRRALASPGVMALEFWLAGPLRARLQPGRARDQSAGALDDRALLSRDLASFRPAPGTLNEFAAYSLTHTVFYLTRFGENPERLPAEHRRYLARWAPVWGEDYYWRQHWDLMSEMVMVLRCLGENDDCDWAGRLWAAQDESGLIPGPTGDGRHLDPRCTDPERIHFLENYHPTLVGLISPRRSSLDGSTIPRSH